MYENNHDNEADLLKKILPSGEKRRVFVIRILYQILQAATKAQISGYGLGTTCGVGWIMIGK